jgi:hypothetical protein
MRMFALSATAVALLLAGCETTPRQQCQAPYRAELRTAMAELRETETDLRRGYTLTPARDDFGMHYCLMPTGAPRLCTVEDGEPMYDKRPINRAAERAKLAALKGEVQRLNAALARCAAEYPE